MDQVVAALAQLFGVTVGSGIGGALVVALVISIQPLQRIVERAAGMPMERKLNAYRSELQTKLEDHKSSNQKEGSGSSETASDVEVVAHEEQVQTNEVHVFGLREG